MLLIGLIAHLHGGLVKFLVVPFLKLGKLRFNSPHLEFGENETYLVQRMGGSEITLMTGTGQNKALSTQHHDNPIQLTI